MIAIDLPMGQPRKLVQALGWPMSWEAYVGLVGMMTKADFVQRISAYCDGRPKGSKHHLRKTDLISGACSPMMLYGVPVGKMFFEGAPRIQRSDVSVLPCRPTNSTQVVVEAYPALIARQLLGSRRPSYKGKRRGQQQEQEAIRSRHRLLNACVDGSADKFSVKLHVGAMDAERVIADRQGDLLDAVLSAYQAALAYRAHGPSLGIPADADPVEGWIVGSDP